LRPPIRAALIENPKNPFSSEKTEEKERKRKFICFPLENLAFVVRRCCKQGNKY
jgi:hypothetical protein